MVCKAIPALNHVLRDARMRLQCEDMYYDKQPTEGGYRLGFFKRK